MKYLLIILFSLYVLSSGAGNRVIQKEDEKEVSIDEFIHKDTPKDAGFFHVYVQDGRYYLEVRERHRKSGVRMLVLGMAGTPCMIG